MGSVQHPTFRTLLLTLYSHDANTPAQNRSQLGVAEFVNGAVIVDCRVDHLHGFAIEAIGDLLEGPALLVHDAAKICPGVEPGGGKLIGCLKEHENDVTIGCAKELKAIKSKMGK
jgi:hypothetical protein